jgi:hypothetical protein
VENIFADKTIEKFKKMCDPEPLTKLDMYNSAFFDELITSEDVKMHEVDQEEEAKLEKTIQEYVDSISSTSISFSKFDELMDSKINRYLFTTILNKTKDFDLQNETRYKNMSKLINCLLKGCHRNDDSDYLKCIVTNASKFYYDVEEADDAVIRTYATEGIRKNKIWDNAPLWGKAIFKDFRDILRKFKIPEDQEKEVDKDQVLRNVLFNRFIFYIEKLAYFDMEADEIEKIISK